MSSHNLQSSRQIWTEYWRSGRRGCLTDEAPASARDHIGSVWRKWFEQQARGARILDLATGAGEVARTALSVGNEAELMFVVDGVDLAQLEGVVETRASAGGTTMRLQGGIDLARLPFADSSFDCAVSQFGIEYTDEKAAGRELARVLKKNGRGLFLAHHRQSVISDAAASRLRAYDSVIGDGAVMDRAKRAYESIAEWASESQRAIRVSEFRQSLRAALSAHSAGFAWELNLREVLGFLSDLARDPAVYDPHDALRRLETASGMIAAWRSRQHSQLAAARDERGITVFAEAIGGFGLRPSKIDVVRDPAYGTILAWQVAFARNT